MMTTRRLMALGFAAVIAGCYVFRSTSPCEADVDCDRGTVCNGGDGYCRTGAPIRVGLLLPATGAQASTATERLQGADFGRWVVERDLGRRVLGRGLAFVEADTLSSDVEARRAAEGLIAKNVVAVIGPGASSEVLTAQEATFPARLLHIAPSAGASAVGDVQGSLAGRYLFQLSTEIRTGSIRVLPLFLAHADRPAAYDACYDGMAIVVTDDTTGTSYDEGLRQLMPGNCVPVTQVVRTQTTKKGDYAAEVTALVEARNEANVKTRCLVIATRPDVAGELLRTLASRERTSAEPYVAFIGASLLNAPSFFDEAKSPVEGAPSLAEGFFGFDGDSSPARAAGRDLADLFEEYKAEHPEIPPDAAMGSNRGSWAEAVILLSLAIELAGTASDAAAVRDSFIAVANPEEGDLAIGPKQLDAAFARIRAARADGRRAGLDYRGALSNYDFDDRGFVRLPGQVWRAAGDKIQQRWAGFDEDELATVDADPGPACARKPK